MLFRLEWFFFLIVFQLLNINSLFPPTVCFYVVAKFICKWWKGFPSICFLQTPTNQNVLCLCRSFSRFARVDQAFKTDFSFISCLLSSYLELQFNRHSVIPQKEQNDLKVHRTGKYRTAFSGIDSGTVVRKKFSHKPVGLKGRLWKLNSFGVFSKRYVRNNCWRNGV